MKKICFICLMLLVPVLGYSTTISCINKHWQGTHRTITKGDLCLFEKDGDVVLSSDEVLHGVDFNERKFSVESHYVSYSQF